MVVVQWQQYYLLLMAKKQDVPLGLNAASYKEQRLALAADRTAASSSQALLDGEGLLAVCDGPGAAEQQPLLLLGGSSDSEPDHPVAIVRPPLMPAPSVEA